MRTEIYEKKYCDAGLSKKLDYTFAPFIVCLSCGLILGREKPQNGGYRAE